MNTIKTSEDNTGTSEWQRGCYPDAGAEYSTYPIMCYTSEPCMVITPKHRMTMAVYVCAQGLTPQNDGSKNEWAGWVEIPNWQTWVKGPCEDWSFVDNVYGGKTIQVVLWKVYSAQQDWGCIRR